MRVRFMSVGVLLGLLVAHAAGAAELRVLSGGAIEPGLTAAAAAYQRDTGHEVRITFNTTPQIRERISRGEMVDVVIAPPAAIEEFAKAGKLETDRISIGRVGLGVAIRPGAPEPDISSPEMLRRAVLEADSIVFNRASTGLYFEELLKKLGIFDQVASRTVRYPDGASVMEHVLHKGQGREIGFGPITEILLYKDKGLQLVGPLPAAIQNYTAYVAAPMAGGPQVEGAKAFARYLGSPAGSAHFRAAGIE